MSSIKSQSSPTAARSRPLPPPPPPSPPCITAITAIDAAKNSTDSTAIAFINALITATQLIIIAGNLPEVQDVADRELVLGVRIAEHQRKKFVVAEAVRSQRARKYWHPKEQSMMLDWQSNNTRKQLENAIAENKRELTVTLIKRGAPADVETPGGLTAVIRSTVSTDKACLKKLVEHGADINYFNKKHGMSALCFAARRDDLIMMHALLDNGAYAGLEGPTGLCPLNVAAFYGHKEPVNVLTEFVVRNGISGGLESERILNYQVKN